MDGIVMQRAASEELQKKACLTTFMASQLPPVPRKGGSKRPRCLELPTNNFMSVSSREAASPGSCCSNRSTIMLSLDHADSAQLNNTFLPEQPHILGSSSFDSRSMHCNPSLSAALVNEPGPSDSQPLLPAEPYFVTAAQSASQSCSQTTTTGMLATCSTSLAARRSFSARLSVHVPPAIFEPSEDPHLKKQRRIQQQQQQPRQRLSHNKSHSLPSTVDNGAISLRQQEHEAHMEGSQAQLSAVSLSAEDKPPTSAWATHVGWFSKCRGCGNQTGHCYYLGRGIPFCKRCTRELDALQPDVRVNFEMLLPNIHEGWLKIGW